MEKIDYTAIDLELLRIDTILGVDLYLKNQQSYTLYRAQNIPFNDKIRRNLLNHGVKELYIKSRDTLKFNLYLENNLSGILSDPDIGIEVKRQVVYESSLNIARDLIQNPGSITTLKRSTQVVRNLVDLQLKDRGGFQKVAELMPVDYKIFTHSANVATFSIAIGNSLGISKSDLYELGLGALLHDIGKSKIPKMLLEKPGPLTDDEFNLVKRHVVYGINIAERNPIVPKNSFHPILYHHERLSGAGYPHGKNGNEIPFYGMIAAVADSFDAMTTNRVYQKAYSTFQALEMLLSDSANYDHRAVLALTRLLGPGGKDEILRPPLIISQPLL